MIDPSQPAFEQTLARWKADVPAREARWTVARGLLRCHSCSASIVAGDSFRQVTKHNWPFCAKCAKARFEEDPPARVLPATPLKLAVPSSFSRFEPRDITARQLGEREPGEDG